MKNVEILDENKFADGKLILGKLEGFDLVGQFGVFCNGGLNCCFGRKYLADEARMELLNDEGLECVGIEVKKIESFIVDGFGIGIFYDSKLMEFYLDEDLGRENYEWQLREG